MADIKHTWIFFGPRSEQWSETWYVIAPSARESLNIYGNALLNSRLAFLHPQCSLRMIRAANVNGLRDTDQYLLNLPGQRTVPADAAGGSIDVTAVTAIWELQGISGSRRKIFFRGLADDDVKRSLVNGQDNPPATLLDPVKAFLEKASANNFSLRSRQGPEAPNAGYRLASGVDGSNNPGRSVVGVENTVGLAIGDRVTLSSFNEKNLPGINAEFTILSQAPLSITIGYSTPGFQNFPGVTGRVRKVAWNPLDRVSPAECAFDRYGTRQTKASFFGSRGAKFAQRRRRLA